jgi:hypothetical protein
VFKGRAARQAQASAPSKSQGPLTRAAKQAHEESASAPETYSQTASLKLTSAAIMATNGASNEKSYFEQQRELLVGDVAASLENVLQNMNRLNRSLEGVIAVRFKKCNYQVYMC